MRRFLLIAALVGVSLFGASNIALAQHGHYGGHYAAPTSHHHHGQSSGYYGAYPSGHGHGGYAPNYSGYGHGHGHSAPQVPYGGYGYGGYTQPYQNHGGLQIVTPGFGLSIGGHHHH